MVLACDGMDRSRCRMKVVFASDDDDDAGLVSLRNVRNDANGEATILLIRWLGDTGANE